MTVSQRNLHHCWGHCMMFIRRCLLLSDDPPTLDISLPKAATAFLAPTDITWCPVSSPGTESHASPGPDSHPQTGVGDGVYTCLRGPRIQTSLEPALKHWRPSQ